MQELQRCVDSGAGGGGGALHSLRLGAVVRVVEDFFSIGNVKLKRGRSDGAAAVPSVLNWLNFIGSQLWMFSVR